ncbi:MAG: hypothetical protein IJ357_03290 [Oscillospiraceae bacterium]|nr:hypothetical protein [Oscillospiraceae bacterium]
MENKTKEQKQPVVVCDIQFRSGSKIYFFNPGKLTVKTDDDVIIETSRGAEFGHCVRGNHTVAPSELVAPLRPVIRLATAQDRRTEAEVRQREKYAHQVCLQKIAELKLDMQLVSAECAFDGSKILFFFTADGRVDFRELVKSLASILRTRIELRQIGVRDKAKMVGGLGICGRPFCCREFLEDFQPVSIKMAKTQNLSLNPTKISGTCGRLMCCLNYEQEAYEDLLRTSPKAESFVDTPDGRGTVTDVNLLKQSVRVRLEKQPDTIVCHKNCDICVIRNGKAKKTDAPIPEDYAPISGNQAKKPKAEPSFSTYLEPVVFRGTQITDPVPEEQEKSKHRRRRGGKKHKAEGAAEAPNTQGTPKQPRQPETPPKAKSRPAESGKPEGDKGQQKPHQKKKPAEKTEKTGEKAAEKAPKAPSEDRPAGPKPKHHRHYHKRRKPSGNKSEGGKAE